MKRNKVKAFVLHRISQTKSRQCRPARRQCISTGERQFCIVVTTSGSLAMLSFCGGIIIGAPAYHAVRTIPAGGITVPLSFPF